MNDTNILVVVGAMALILLNSWKFITEYITNSINQTKIDSQEIIHLKNEIETLKDQNTKLTQYAKHILAERNEARLIARKYKRMYDDLRK